MKNVWIAFFAGLAVGFVLLFFQQVCQNDTTGDLSATPFWWPCPKGASVIKSASTN